MTSQIGPQIITMHILPNISRTTKGKHAMKFGQLITYEIFIFKDHAD